MSKTIEIIDSERIGKKGFPMHYEAFGLEPPKKVVPIEDGIPQSSHPGLTMAEQVDIERERRIDGGFSFNGVRFQSRPQDRENITGASVAALAALTAGAQAGDYRWHGGDEDFVWIAEDNTLHLMDAQTLFAFGQAAMAHKQAMIFSARALKDMADIPSDFTDDKYWVVL